MHNLKITSNKGETRIFLDEFELLGAIGYKLSNKAGNPAILEVSLVVDSVEAGITYQETRNQLL